MVSPLSSQSIASISRRGYALHGLAFIRSSDRFYIKKFEDETNLRCHFLVDRSSSMAYTSSAYTKADYGSTLAATLAYFLSMQGDAFGLATFDESLADYIPPRNRPGHLRQFMLALEGAPKGRSTNLVTPLSHLAEILNRRGSYCINF